jgi:Tfp pilus assembly protein PilX
MTDPTMLTAGIPAEKASGRRDGFALPMAIVVLALLTMGLVAGFAMTSSEMSTAQSQRAEARAYSNAQRGLEAFLTRRKEKSGAVMFCPNCWAVNANPASGSVQANLDKLPTARETVTVAFPQGMAVVRVTPVSVNTVTGRGKYFVTSTGYDSTSGLGGGLGRSSMASRTVGVFVTWSTSTINVVSAWTSLTGIVKNGTGAIDGRDQCGSGHDVAGLSVPQYGGHADMSIQGNFQPTGSPPYDTTKTFAQESASVKIDWSSVKSGTAIQADIIIGTGTFPSIATFAADTNFWPIIHVTNGASGTYSLPNQGRGMLIVDGNLTISGSNQWYGVILVGGVLTSNGNNVSEGATLSGLNALTGTRPSSSSADDALANGQKSYVYDSCSVAKATSALARYSVMLNTWMDNLPGY